MGALPHAGQRSRRARHHKTSIGGEGFAGGGNGVGTGWGWGAAFIVPLSYRQNELLPNAPLAATARQCYGQAMYTLARLLQITGLTIPVLAIFAQLNERISASKMLGFLVVSVLIFLIGYTLQRTTGGSSR